MPIRRAPWERHALTHIRWSRCRRGKRSSAANVLRGTRRTTKYASVRCLLCNNCHDVLLLKQIIPFCSNVFVSNAQNPDSVYVIGKISTAKWLDFICHM